MQKLWVTQNKFYKAHVLKDQSGKWVIYRWWGSLTNKRGNSQVSVIKNHEEAYNALKLISKRRIAHGYVEVF